jgi:serine/threonine protein kinase
VHWALEECDGILRLFELYEDTDFVYLVLEYQAEGSLMEGILQKKRLNEE